MEMTTEKVHTVKVHGPPGSVVSKGDITFRSMDQVRIIVAALDAMLSFPTGFSQLTIHGGQDARLVLITDKKKETV